jgi:uncharacterized protein YndB with AHSA1/START domain
MAQVTRRFNAAPQRVFDVLADPACYQHWVVGASEVVQSDSGWPAVGTTFEHRVGVWPIRVADHTRVVASDPPRMLRLAAKARPLGTATVTMEIEPDGAGSMVTMTEEPRDRFTAAFFNRITDPLIRMRNVESLRRLAALAEG